MAETIQTSLLCGCGGDVDCPKCRRRQRLDREAFGGQRERVLHRDEYSCLGCGAADPEALLVHHRAPGYNVAVKLATLCRRCHNRIHHTYAPSFAMATEWPMLYRFWRELNRGQPVQRLLTEAAARPEQTELPYSSAA